MSPEALAIIGVLGMTCIGAGLGLMVISLQRARQKDSRCTLARIESHVYDVSQGVVRLESESFVAGRRLARMERDGELRELRDENARLREELAGLDDEPLERKVRAVADAQLGNVEKLGLQEDLAEKLHGKVDRAIFDAIRERSRRRADAEQGPAEKAAEPKAQWAEGDTAGAHKGSLVWYPAKCNLVWYPPGSPWKGGKTPDAETVAHWQEDDRRYSATIGPGRDYPDVRSWIVETDGLRTGCWHIAGLAVASPGRGDADGGGGPRPLHGLMDAQGQLCVPPAILTGWPWEAEKAAEPKAQEMDHKDDALPYVDKGSFVQDPPGTPGKAEKADAEPMMHGVPVTWAQGLEKHPPGAPDA